jgi:iron(III) transport system ATP-binding protein
MALALLEKMAEKPYLNIEGLTKFYNGVAVLENLNLSVKKYEKIGIIGQSGSGKSTLLRLIYGLLDKDAGQITLENDRVKDRSEVLVPGDDRVKYVRQNYELFPDHSVYENIEHPIRFHKKEYIEKRIQKLLKAFDIEHIKDVKTKLASGGEQQRVAICCALAESPKLLLLDEPMAHLDPVNARIIKNYLWKFIDKERITTIFVTHSAEDALAYASRIAVMHNSKIIETGEAQHLYQNPKRKITAQLLGIANKIDKSLLDTELQNTTKTAYLRPENLVLTDSNTNFEVEINSSFYYGKEYLIEAKWQKQTLFFYSVKKLETQTKAFLHFDSDKVFWV